MLIVLNWPSFPPLICTYKLALANLLVNISCKNMRSKWTVLQQMLYFFLQNYLSIFLPTYPYIEIGASEWDTNFSWCEKLHLPLSMQNQQTLSLWGGNAYFFLLKISQKQLLLSYFGWIFWEQLVTAILYTVDGWQEPGYGRGISKT